MVGALDELTHAALTWAVPVIMSGMFAAVLRLFRRVDAMQEGTRAILRSRLLDLHERYVVTGDGCPYWVKDEAEQVYRAYHGLGGNGTGTHYYREIMKMHVDGAGR